jgi:hypothetical protein
MIYLDLLKSPDAGCWFHPLVGRVAFAAADLFGLVAIFKDGSPTPDVLGELVA